MPMVNLRLSDEEQIILDFAVEQCHFSSRKTFIMDFVRECVHGIVFNIHGGFPEDYRVSDKQLLALIEAHEFQRIEKLSMFFTENMDKDLFVKQNGFTDLEDYEEQRKKAYEKAGLKYERSDK